MRIRTLLHSLSMDTTYEKKDLMLIAITIFATIVAWVLVEIYVIQSSTPTDEDVEAIDVNFEIDTEIFNELRERSL